MDILARLSSQAGDRGANHEVAALCLGDKTLIPGIVAGLEHRNNKVVVDCAEVLTEIAKVQPAWVAPHVAVLPALLDNRNNRARWEGMHCLALIAGHSPGTIDPMLGRLEEIIDTDESVIVRDYAIDALGQYAGTGRDAARIAFPVLEHALSVWEGRHVKLVLTGLLGVVPNLPESKDRIRSIAEQYLAHEKAAVKAAARKLFRVS